MKRLSLVLGLLFLGCAPAPSENAQVLHGTYHWDNGEDGPLEATFEPTGPETWDVKFEFRFDGKDKTWKGTAVGSLTDGELEGRVKAGLRRRVFIFEGEFNQGVFEGRHAEVNDRERIPTGTLTLAQK